jgi:hypothetical protein
VAIFEKNGEFSSHHHSIDGTGKFSDQPATSRVDEPPAVRGDRRLDKIAEEARDSAMRAFLILFHKPAVPDHVGSQDSSQLAADAPNFFFGHPAILM